MSKLELRMELQNEEPDFDGAGKAHYGEAEWDRMEAKEARANESACLMDAYVMNQSWWSQRTADQILAKYGEQVDGLIERGFLARNAGGRIQMTDMGSRYYRDLPRFFTIDRSGVPYRFDIELVAKGESTAWVTITKDTQDEDGDGVAPPAEVNWSAIGAQHREVTLTFAAMLTEASAIAERLNLEHR